MATKAGIGVEAEIGEIHGVEDDMVVDAVHYTDPSEAEKFCRELDLAAFAAAIGTAHGYYKGEPDVKFDLIGEINRRTNTPMALHGGTGLNDEIIQKCIKLGCAKINISTNLKHVFIDSFIDYHQKNKKYEPLHVLGAQFEALKQLFKEKIAQFGGTNRGSELCRRSPEPASTSCHEGSDLRLRRCARRHRARRPSRRLQPRLRRSRHPRRVGREALRRAPEDRRRQRAHEALLRHQGLADRQDRRDADPRAAQEEDRDLHGARSQAAACRCAPASRASSTRRTPPASGSASARRPTRSRSTACSTSWAPKRKAWFEIVLAGDIVEEEKAGPRDLQSSRNRSSVSTASDCVVVEDSRNGLLASLGAGMPTLITTSTYTKDEDFEGAARVVPELGDAPKVLVTLKDLEAIAGA